MKKYIKPAMGFVAVRTMSGLLTESNLEVDKSTKFGGTFDSHSDDEDNEW